MRFSSFVQRDITIIKNVLNNAIIAVMVLKALLLSKSGEQNIIKANSIDTVKHEMLIIAKNLFLFNTLSSLTIKPQPTHKVANINKNLNGTPLNTSSPKIPRIKNKHVMPNETSEEIKSAFLIFIIYFSKIKITLLNTFDKQWL